MPKLVIQNDQSSATGKDIHDFDGNINATKMIMKHLPNGINPDNCKIFINSDEINITDKPDDRLFETLNNDDVVLVLNEVKGLDPLTIALIAVVASIATVVLLTPKLPGNVGQRKDSPNNNLQGQTNVVRPYQAYPLIFGSPRAYPDLTGEAVSEYINNQKIVTQLMNVGVGLFDITEVRAGETPIGNFTGATSTIFAPVSKVVTVPSVTTAFATNEIDGQELLGTNEGVDGVSYNLVQSVPAGYIGSTFTFTVVQDTESDDLKTAFDAAATAFNVSLDYEIGGSPETGSGEMSSMTLSTGVYTIIIIDFTGPKTDPTEPASYTGPYTVTTKLGVAIGPIKTALETEELWFDIIFQRGLKGTVNIRLETQELDGLGGSPIGSPTITLFSFTESTLEQQFFTHKEVLASKSFYQFIISRTNNSLQDTENPDQAKLEAVRSINTFTNLTFANNTLIEVVVPATINATSLRENKINLSLTSKLITYNGVSVVTTPAASRKMADALLHMYVDFFGLDANTLALDELYEIQNRLDAIDTRLATFDFTFDDIDVSLDERMDAILQVARCFKWLDGDVYRFARDEERAFAATTITRRDIAKDVREYSMSYNPQLLEAFDSVKIEFVDKLTNKKSYVFRKIDGLGDVIDGVGSNPKTMELAGCSEEFNAINRAELEMRKLIFQRWTLNETMLPSGMLLSRGDMVLYAEQYTSDLFDGEILAVNGNIATTSESIDFSVGSLQLHYMLQDGTKVGPFAITEVVDEPFQFESTDLGQVFVRDSTIGFTIQTGSRYIIGTTTDLDAARWSVVEKEATGNNVQLSMINYDDRIYDFD